MQWLVKTADGRTLSVEDAGDLAGRPVLVHVGTPNSRHLYGQVVADAAARGLRLISYDRGFLVDEALCMQQAYGPGIEGCWDDCYAQAIPWGFDLARISVPVLLMHGVRDEAVPFGHGQWLAAHIPGVEARMFDRDGHSSVRENHIGEVHAWLKAVGQAAT